MSALGQKQTYAVQKPHVRFTPESGHMQCTRPCLLWAISGHATIFSVNLEKPAVCVALNLGRDLARRV